VSESEHEFAGLKVIYNGAKSVTDNSVLEGGFAGSRDQGIIIIAIADDRNWIKRTVTK